MKDKIEKLSLWLSSKGFQREGQSVGSLLKAAGMRPIPVNRAEINYVADELLGQIKEKLLKMKSISLSGLEGLGFSPSILHDVMLSGESNFFETTEISPIINISTADPDVREQVLAAAKILGSSEDYSEAIERLESLAANIKAASPEGSDHIDSFFLEEQVLNSMPQNLSDYLNATASMAKKNIAGEDILINYILTFTDTIPGGGDASWDSDPDKTPPEHTITLRYHPGSPTLQTEVLRYQAEQGFHGETYEDEVDKFIASIKPYIVRSLTHEQTHAEDVISDTASSKGETRWESSSGKNRTLEQVAVDSGVKGGALRLFVINYNNLFGEELGYIHSYQDIYERFAGSGYLETLIKTEVPEGKVIKLSPSYKELYFYDRAFYVFSREELKAHLNDVLTELIQAFEQDKFLEIENMRPEDLIGLSETASYILRLSRPQPVDELIKTPLGFLDKLKAKRKKDFEFGINYIYDVMVEKFGDEDLVKESVLKRRMRRTRGEGKDRMEWGLFSKKKPKKVLKWFGPKKPSKKQVAKEEARIHAFSGG